MALTGNYALNQQTVTITADTYAGAPYVRMTLDPNPARGKVHAATERAAMDRMIRAVWGPDAGVNLAPAARSALRRWAARTETTR